MFDHAYKADKPPPGTNNQQLIKSRIEFESDGFGGGSWRSNAAQSEAIPTEHIMCWEAKKKEWLLDTKELRYALQISMITA